MQDLTIVVNIPGISPVLMEDEELTPNLNSIKEQGTYRTMTPSFPAVTCSVQTTLLTGKMPQDHGIVANGVFNRELLQFGFWEQQDKLVKGPRFWDVVKKSSPETKIAVLFFQLSKYINADIVVTPAPLHEEGGMKNWCYSKPVGYYESVSEKIGEFPLHHYWGPVANINSSRWILDCAKLTLKDERPDITFIYIPHLDYNAQRFGPKSKQFYSDVNVVDEMIGELLKFLKEMMDKDDKFTLFVVSEYAFSEVNKSIEINKHLRKSKLLKVREIKGAEYLDIELSDAWAMVDHQIAHVYCKKDKIDNAKAVLKMIKGIKNIWDEEGQKENDIFNPRSGDLIAVADNDKWFSYYYWLDEGNAPPFVKTVDIHRKPGFDPLELFFSEDKKSISMDTALIKGSHGAPPEDDSHKAIMLCTDKELDSYAPADFYAEQFMMMLFRVI